jgi:DDE superfamily endonuclease
LPKRALASKQVGKVVSAEKGKTTTIVCAMNASGTYFPLMISIKRKNMNDRLMRGVPLDAVGVPSANGWMDTSTVVKYFHHFIKHVKPSPSSPCLLILDGHGSHKSLDAVTLAEENDITLITIPSPTSHKL